MAILTAVTFSLSQLAVGATVLSDQQMSKVTAGTSASSSASAENSVTSSAVAASTQGQPAFAAVKIVESAKAVATSQP
jgi:hypothetical protein